ncbi:helix-turn-helix domain-containing protein [Falsihalocynthiibacter sp. SS001]|uniref:helix-turn-helix domain-containing protein n=1 Tax=Falsihalocynthiibacter sp. SS001 TaxID=3349698 RepID=UPI0036D423D8
MAARELTGRRIRDRRVAIGVKQADLAQKVGISPSYLNLIEHNRRRIGGKLLVDIARALDVDPSTLSEGTEATLLARLLSAAANQMGERPEVDEIEAFTARFPGWAALLAGQTKRVSGLERQVETLTDRLAHDPILSGAMHEVLSTVTAIRSTAAILADPQEMEQAWRDRFQRNLYEDSVRLAESSQALVAYLDRDDQAITRAGTPIEVLETYLRSQSFYLPKLENVGANISDQIKAANLQGEAANDAARKYFERYVQDAMDMPRAAFQEAAQQEKYDPARLALRFSTSISSAMRRLLVLPSQGENAAIGLAICDGAGTMTMRQPIDGFPLPRFTGAHQDWPLYQALRAPSVPIRRCVQQGQGSSARRFMVYAICETTSPLSFDTAPRLEATMLILPATLAPEALAGAPDLVFSGTHFGEA